MPRNWTRFAVLATAGMIVVTASARAGDPTASLKQGNPQLKSAGPLGFGPDGILFVGDTQGSAVFAIDTADRTAAGQKAPVQVNDLAAKAAAMLGTKPQQIMINDLAVNPISGNVYLSVVARPGPRCSARAHAPGCRRQARRGRRSITSGSPGPRSPTPRTRRQAAR